MLFVCAIAGAAPPSVAETCALFRLRQKQKARRAATANATNSTPLPIPAFAAVERLGFLVGARVGEYNVVVEEVLARDVFVRIVADVALRDGEEADE